MADDLARLATTSDGPARVAFAVSGVAFSFKKGRGVGANVGVNLGVRHEVSPQGLKCGTG